MVQYDIRKLLQICMKTSEPGGARVVDILRCMDRSESHLSAQRQRLRGYRGSILNTIWEINKYRVQ